MMEFALLASGSKGNSFVLRDGTGVIMIDCGTTKKYLFSSLEKIHVSKNEIDALLITHDHSDHISQIRHFGDLPVYSPVEIDGIDCFHVTPMHPFFIETMKITPLALSHDAPSTVGYVIEDGIEKLVYITDTGYVNQNYIPYLKDADYIVLESNHDVSMLMATRRPQFLKYRIYSDQGHLCNEDCAEVLKQIISPKTKMIILAHISEEANTREKALETSRALLLDECRERMNEKLVLAAAGQHEMIRKGFEDEEMDPGSVSCFIGMERHSDLFHC
ncbi:MAG: MBL fold metallo-hydrolase [Erysipelotrichaceae bacterium]|nr:MBL fold metallo-hydrolase [Erysipelotrichaceae bacterium]